ncbi:ABC transporter substrate-binding protein [Fervidobacterium thailandense]|uniref:ABC transporter substrate-binding protein n=1 Tax=Fervidobacterium thailandense TaxID=1008305 RepID=A0A1E3G5T5_9BACT|nr:ABC transporter substrate-binding protein [Fervidobacterium thailandense]
MCLKNIASWIIILVVFLILVHPVNANSSEIVIKVGFLLGSPYAFWSASSLTGIDVEICRLLSKEMKCQFEYYVLPFSALDTNVLNILGLDLVAGGIHITEKRKKLFTFSVPYLRSGLAIVLRKGLNWDGNVERITFAVKNGATGETLVREWVKSGKKVKYEVLVSNQEILAKLVLGQVDAGFFDYINALYLNKNYGLQVWPRLIYEVEIGMVILNSRLASRINDTMLKNKQQIKNIVMQYVGSF